jgi:hypothetical protein
VRAIAGEKTAFAYADEINIDTLMQAARSTRVIGNMGGKKKIALGKNKEKNQRVLYLANDPILSLVTEEKIALLKKLSVVQEQKIPGWFKSWLVFQGNLILYSWLEQTVVLQQIFVHLSVFQLQ